MGRRLRGAPARGCLAMTALHQVRLKLNEAQAYVERYHRHSPPLKRHKFSVGALPFPLRDNSPFEIPLTTSNRDEPFLYGIVTVDTPSSHEWSKHRGYVEIRRLVTTSNLPNVASFLIGKAKQACFAMGYGRIITYTRVTEPGTSLRASGFNVVRARRGLVTWACYLGGAPVSDPLDLRREFTKDTLAKIADVVHDP